MKLVCLKSALKCNSFDVIIDIKIPFFGVLVTIEPGHSLSTVHYHELYEKTIKKGKKAKTTKKETKKTNKTEKNEKTKKIVFA